MIHIGFDIFERWPQSQQDKGQYGEEEGKKAQGAVQDGRGDGQTASQAIGKILIFYVISGILIN